jgi:hypothetical protein
MTDEKWLDLKYDLKEKFNIIEDKTEDLMVKAEEGEKKIGTLDILICQTPMGKIKLERANKPVILDKKVHYHRKKEGSKIEYIYSDTEWTHRLEAYKWDEEDSNWQKIDTSSFSK